MKPAPVSRHYEKWAGTSVPHSPSPDSPPSIVGASHPAPACATDDSAARSATAHRYCRRCETIKPVEAFGQRIRHGRPVTQPYCKPCMVSYHTEWRHGAGKAKHAKSNAASRDRYPERERARNAVANALRLGKLERGTACEFAGPDCSGILEAHHDDYSRPLDVRWVCRGHHRRLDQARRRRPSRVEPAR